jgi:hypothetical protein
VTAKDKAELQARSDKRRANSEDYRDLATKINDLNAHSVRDPTPLNEDAIRADRQRRALAETPAPTTATFKPTFRNEEVVAIALDYLERLRADGRATTAR